MRLVAAAAMVLVVAGCDQGGSIQWSKPGANAADYQRDAFECERETRMVAHTFTPGLFRDAEANAYASRCMAARGYTAGRYGDGPTASITPVLRPSPMSDATGRQYSDGDRVNCRFRTVQSVTMAAKTCSQGGGTILGPATSI